VVKKVLLKNAKRVVEQAFRSAFSSLDQGFIQQMQSVCSECEGQGEQINPKDRCKECHGRKIVRERKVLEVHVDKGD
jgi:DnaJ-class molecular chaperone